MADEFNYDFGYGDTGDVSIGNTSGYNYDFGYGGAGDVSVGNTGTPGTYAPTTVSASSPDFLSRLFSGNMTSGDKAGTMLGLGALAIAQSLANKPPTIKQPVYKQAPVYNRALTAPMYGLGYLNPQTGKQVGMGMPLFFNPNPFQFDPTEAAKRYGPTPEEIAAGQQVYQQKMAELYTPRTVPDVQMTGSSLDQSAATGITTGDPTRGATSTAAGGTTGITSGDPTIRPPKDAAAPLVPPPPAPSTSSAQTTQSSGATTQVPSTVSSNVVPEGYFRNPVKSSGSLSQIPGALNEGEFLPILKDADWYMTRDLEDVPKDLSRTWRDPVSGYGISVDPYRDVSAAAFTYYDPQGRKLRSSIFNPAELYKNAQEFGIDLSGISELGKKLDAAGVPYKPGQLYAGTGSNLGINFADIAAKKLGSSYDWTQDPFVSQKGQSSVERLAELQALAQKLGIDLTKSENLATLSPQLAGDVTRQFVVYTPSISGSPMYSFYGTQEEADQAAKQYGGTVINLGGKTIDAPGGASGGSIDDILVGYDGGAIGYDAGGDVYAYAKGQYLQGDGDGMSDSIPATINNKQPARLSDGEFVIPADVVAHLGNGSSKAGAQKLYDMMARVRKARTGTDKQAPEINPNKFV